MATNAESSYKKFLKHLSVPHHSQSCSCHLRIHQRNWIPAPCLTTLPLAQPSKTKRWMNSFSYSSPDLSLDTESVMDSTEDDENSSSSDSDQENLILEFDALKKEKKIIQDALKKYDRGEKLPEATKLLIYKRIRPRRNKEPSKHLPKGDTLTHKEQKLPSKTEKRLLGELQRQFKNLNKVEMEQLINDDANKQLKDSSISNCDELRSKNMEAKIERYRDANSTCYQYVVLERKYEDLRQYLEKTEAENKLLKKENKALHCACEEYKNVAESKAKISHLESEVSKLKSYVSRCDDELSYLRSKNEKHKVESQKREEHRESELPLERELSLLKNLNETKIFYEKAIDGYKNELAASKQMIRELKEQQVIFVNQWENKETIMLENFERQINDLKEKLSAKLNKPDDSESRKHLIKLEKLLSEKQSEVRTLQHQLKDYENSKCKPDNFEMQVLEHFEKLFNQAGAGFSATNKTTLLDSIKETVRHCFHELKQSGQLVDDRVMDKKLKLEYDKLSECLKEKTLEAENAKIELKKNKEKMEQLNANLVAKGKDEADFTDGLDALKKLPEMLKSAESKLSESEELQQKLVIENRLLIERLERSQCELIVKQEQIQLLESRISKQNDSIKSLEKDVEKFETKMENLQKLVERKDEILERNSTQLEERIRACASLNAQIEKLKDNHNEEIRELRNLSQVQDSHCHSKLLDLQTEKAKLEGDYAALKSDRSNLERNFKRQIKALEDEIETLNFKNKTYQRQLETISSTYKSLFSSTSEAN